MKSGCNFVNDGPFWDKYPDVWPDVRRYERFDTEGSLIESWERDTNGRMVEVTQRDKLREEILAAQEQIERLEAEQ